MKALQDLFSTDYGIMSFVVIAAIVVAGLMLLRREPPAPEPAAVAAPEAPAPQPPASLDIMPHVLKYADQVHHPMRRQAPFSSRQHEIFGAKQNLSNATI